jgi:4'-phosphopantetheinyl transferase
MCSPGEVHVHLFRLSGPTPANLDRILSRDERDRAERFQVKNSRDLFIAAHCALRTTLAAYLHQEPQSLEFQTDSYGKPFLSRGKIQFNMSHSHDAIAIAVCNDVVGIDVECIRPGVYTRSLSESCLGRSERAWLLDQEDPELAFYRVWTLKEAAVKADGRGLSLEFASIVAIPHGIDQASPITIDSMTWWGRELTPPSGFCLAVATPKPTVVIAYSHDAMEVRCGAG